MPRPMAQPMSHEPRATLRRKLTAQPRPGEATAPRPRGVAHEVAAQPMPRATAWPTSMAMIQPSSRATAQPKGPRAYDSQPTAHKLTALHKPAAHEPKLTRPTAHPTPQGQRAEARQRQRQRCWHYQRLQGWQCHGRGRRHRKGRRNTSRHREQPRLRLTLQPRSRRAAHELVVQPTATVTAQPASMATVRPRPKSTAQPTAKAHRPTTPQRPTAHEPRPSAHKPTAYKPRLIVHGPRLKAQPTTHEPAPRPTAWQAVHEPKSTRRLTAYSSKSVTKALSAVAGAQKQANVAMVV
jgi:hypothetical protein